MNEPTANDSKKLSQLIAQAKAGKTTKADALDMHRRVLLKERAEGTSVRILVAALGQMGTHVSEETLRLWFVKQESSCSQAPTPEPVRTVTKPKVSVSVPVSIRVVQSTLTGPRVARSDI
ncbi:MAG: hypothetical protein H2172_10045 [Opitutus sp.]|nr:hypothetical protein [Opitutus sp.]MCS6275452.1 hypothetical protein [Opitutus sp.]MCS6276691.1 hypothetical protein [Opitutus sp.]MCS6301660.1 hypothetical protein [Opitutus sp.]